MLKLRIDLEIVADLLETLQRSHSDFSKNMLRHIDAAQVASVVAAIDASFDRQGASEASAFFWIRSGKSPLLDLSRKAYNESIEVPTAAIVQKLFLLVEKYKEALGDTTLKAEFHEKRGHFFSFSHSYTVKDVEAALHTKLIQLVYVPSRPALPC